MTKKSVKRSATKPQQVNNLHLLTVKNPIYIYDRQRMKIRGNAIHSALF
jgi:hypothetical protein